MSLSRLSLPSIGRVLEGEAESVEQNTLLQEESDASTASTSTLASLTPALEPHPHLMRTIDLRDNDLENAEIELYSFIVGFPDDEEPDKDDAQTIFEERRVPEIVAELVEELPEPAQPAARWFRVDFTQWMATIRRLFPVRFAEIFLRKAGRELGQR